MDHHACRLCSRAFNNKDTRKMDIVDWKKVVGALKQAEDLDEAAIEWASRELKARKARKAEEKLMFCRTRKYGLFPAQDQRYTLRRFMSTCRWTYNHAVAHFRETNVYKTSTFRDLYVTRDSSLERACNLSVWDHRRCGHRRPQAVSGETRCASLQPTSRARSATR